MKAFDTENSVWARFSPEQRGQMEAYSVHYRQFLDTARTERLANKEIIRQAENAGFHPLADFTSLKAGDKVYWDQKGKYLPILPNAYLRLLSDNVHGLL